MPIEPYLFFNGRCDEAIEFYREAAGAEVVMLMRFKENPGPHDPNFGDKVMHAQLRIGDATVLVSDGRCQGALAFQGFALSVNVPNEAEAERLFAALGQGGQSLMPLGPTFFARRFGMLNDRFGVTWMVIAPK